MLKRVKVTVFKLHARLHGASNTVKTNKSKTIELICKFCLWFHPDRGLFENMGIFINDNVADGNFQVPGRISSAGNSGRISGSCLDNKRSCQCDKVVGTVFIYHLPLKHIHNLVHVVSQLAVKL